MWFFIALVVTSVASALLSRGAQTSNIEPGEVDVATAKEGENIPTLFGTKTIGNQNILWYGDVKVVAIKKKQKTGLFSSKKITVGYKYYAGMHHGLCRGPVDSVSQILVDDKEAWSGDNDGTEQISIDEPDLFGGTDSEGGIVGDIDILTGGPGQAANDYLEGNIYSDTVVYDGGLFKELYALILSYLAEEPAAPEAIVPGFRGVCSAVLRQVYFGTTPYLKPWKWKAKRIHLADYGVEQWYDEKAEIGEYEVEDITTATYDGVSFSTASEATQPSDLVFSSDGSKMFIVDNLVDYVWQYTLSTPWDLSTASYDSVSFQSENVNNGIAFKTDGLKLYLINRVDNRVYQYSCASAWNISGALYDEKYFNVGSQEDSAEAVSFSSDGSKMYVVGGYGGDRVHQYTLSTPWDVTTASYDDYFLHGLSISTSVVFNADGSRMFVIAYPTDQVFQYTLSTPWDVTTSSERDPDLYFYYGEEASSGTGVDFKSDGSKMYIVGSSHNAVYQYTIETTGYQEGGDMNPAHILREAFTSPEWGMGYPSTDIDSDNTFTDAADALYLENMGISILWDRAASVEDFVADILRHIDASTYVNRSTGKICLKLIRDDYDTGSLVDLDESNILRLEKFTRSTMADLINEVVCKYWDRETNETKTVTVQNVALIQAMGGVVSTTVSYPGFAWSDIAGRVALRDLRTLGTPKISGTLVVNRTGYNLYPGDCFKFSWSKFGISAAVMRVKNVKLGGPTNNEIKIDFVQDIFSTPEIALSTSQVTLWETPDQDPEAPAAHCAFELPYMALIADEGVDAVNTRLDSVPGAGFIGAAAVRPNNVSMSAAVYSDDGGGYAEGGVLDFCPSATLAAAIGYTDESITIENAVDVDLVEAGTWAQIDDEIVVIDAIDGDAGTATIRRGVLDTVPAEHAAGARLYAWEIYTGGDGAEYADTEEIDVKLLTMTAGGVLDIDDATADTVTMDSRAVRPYPPGNLQVESESYPDTIEETGAALTISWVHRDRTQQTTMPYLDYSDAGVGPETGVTYSAYFYLDDVLDDSATGISGASTTWTPSGLGTARVEIYAVRDGYQSMQATTVEFEYVVAGADAVFMLLDY